jgi:2-C-methyl-D-erythritol 4-phosphate cytidylyltransferase
MSSTDHTKPAENFWAIVPAAGAGKRMGAEIPKQYLSVAGKMVIEHTLQRLLDQPEITGLVIALGDHDEYWSDVNIQTNNKQVIRVKGGQERCDSVFNALEALDNLRQQQPSLNITEQDWVLVHDAARPCLRSADVSLLINQVKQQQAKGGLLALPVRDTMKRQLSGKVQVAETVDRTGLWHALTPQMFRLAELKNAISVAIAAGVIITDESSAMEYLGVNPALVEGHEDNIKITRQPDLKLAEMYLKNQANE